MIKFAFSLVTGILMIGLGLGWSQGPGGKDDFKKGPGFEKKGMGPGFELGRVIPPPIMEMLDLNEIQKRQIAELEKEVKTRLQKILNAEQKNKIQNLKDKGPPNFKDKEKNKGKDKKDDPNPPGNEKQSTLEKKSQPGIAWYANVEMGLAEAKRTGKPILLVSAAPHCAGVPGIW